MFFGGPVIFCLDESLYIVGDKKGEASRWDASRKGGSVRGTKIKEEQATTDIESDGVDASDPGMDDADSFIVERIAEAVVRKIDERDKISLLADAVIARLQELGQAPVLENDQAKETVE